MPGAAVVITFEIPAQIVCLEFSPTDCGCTSELPDSTSRPSDHLKHVSIESRSELTILEISNIPKGRCSCGSCAYVSHLSSKLHLCLATCGFFEFPR